MATGPRMFLGDTDVLRTGCKRRTFSFRSPGSCDQEGIYKEVERLVNFTSSLDAMQQTDVNSNTL